MALSGYLLYRHVVFERHVAEDGEDDESGEEAGETVDGGGAEGVYVAVVVEVVVARERNQNSEPHSQREEDLHAIQSILPIVTTSARIEFIQLTRINGVYAYQIVNTSLSIFPTKK